MRRYFALLPVLCLTALLAAVPARAAEGPVIESEEHSFRLVTLVEGLQNPWGLAFLPDGDLLVTERPGRLRLIRAGRLLADPIAGVPKVIARGQGGLLDVALHPDFAANGLVYLSFAGDGYGGAGTAVARGHFDGRQLTDVETIFEALPFAGGGRHFGSRLLFAPDGMLYITAGERGDPDRAQNLGDRAGKIHRVTPEGKVPPDNPFFGRAEAQGEIYSYGHRNPQGLALQPATGRLWAVEHGPRGGDEANILEPGANFGWPVVTYGKSYAGFSIGEGKEKAGMTRPAKYWVPSISPSGLAFYEGAAFPRWQGDLFVGGLSARRLVRLKIEGTKVVGEERLLASLNARIRDVRLGPDGLLYLLTDAKNGQLLRLEPVE